MVVLTCAAAISSMAQMVLELELPQKQFIRNEMLPVRLRIINTSGQKVKVGEVADWLTFSVETRESRVLTPLQPIVGGGQFEMEPAESTTKTLDLGIGYDFSEPGSYRVSASARFPSLNLSVNSPTVSFDIVRGTQLWEEAVGVPVTNAAAPVMIRYSLLQSYHLKELHLYVRVTRDADDSVVRVQPLGSVVSFAAPEKVIDRASQLHVLFQSGPRSFDYCRVSASGDLVNREVYDLTSSRPRLKQDTAGAVVVAGGVSRKISSPTAGPGKPPFAPPNAAPTAKP